MAIDARRYCRNARPRRPGYIADPSRRSESPWRLGSARTPPSSVVSPKLFTAACGRRVIGHQRGPSPYGIALVFCPTEIFFIFVVGRYSANFVPARRAQVVCWFAFGAWRVGRNSLNFAPGVGQYSFRVGQNSWGHVLLNDSTWSVAQSNRPRRGPLQHFSENFIEAQNSPT